MNITSPFVILAILGTAGAAYCLTRSDCPLTSSQKPQKVQNPINTSDKPPSLATLRDITESRQSAKEISERPIIDVRDIPASYVPIDFTRLTR